MHDIICPQCGESFIARDVVFDFSEYILPLISNRENYEAVKALGFKYYADEEVILTNRAENTEVELGGAPSIGVGNDSRNYFHYVVTNAMILEYIQKRAGIDPTNFYNTVENIITKSPSSRGGDNAHDPTTDMFVLKIINCCFPNIAEAVKVDIQTGNQFDISSPRALEVIDVLRRIFNNKDSAIIIDVRMYCSRMNEKRPEYYVPDIMFVLDQTERMNINKKCCRCCGRFLPDEFGYYKMFPVTLLGSHFSGKTSFLFALIWYVNNVPPFNSENFKVRVLKNNDSDLERLANTNVNNFLKGLAPVKTPYEGAPIVSFLIDDNIYTFTDWPGEAFINNTNASQNYVYEDRRIIAKSRHFVFCLDPEHIVPGIRNEEDERENLRFSEVDLIEKFIDHTRHAGDKLRSVTFLANKFDMFGDDIARDVNQVLDDLSESDILSVNRSWDSAKWEAVTKVTEKFFVDGISTFVARAKNQYKKNNISFIPVAPYGREAKEIDENADRIKRGYLVGLPLLHILKSDGII